MIVPEIEASQAFQDNGVIVIWNDETEGDVDRRLHRRLLQHRDRHLEAGCGQRLLGRYPLHPRVRPRHAWQNVFGVWRPIGYLGGAGGATDLSALFQPGVIPTAIPETSTWAMMALGFAGLAGAAAFGRGSRARLALGA